MRIIDRLTGARTSLERSPSVFPQLSLGQWAESFTFNGQSFPGGVGSAVSFTQKNEPVVEPERTMTGYAQQVYAQHGPVAALIFIRQLVFSTVEFSWQRRSDRGLFGSKELRLLERPWHGGTTQNLLAKTIVDADIAGNAYWRVADDGELVRMRPDWVDVVLARREDGSYRKVGYRWWPEGKRGQTTPLDLVADEVVHFMPLQDPLCEWRGMSWLTPVIREVMVDRAASNHQQRFFENAATPNLAVTMDPSITPAKFTEFKEAMSKAHDGSDNAYRTLYLGGGADVTVVGTDLSKLDLKSVQGGVEARLASAAGVPPVVVGFREGLAGSSLNAGNYGQARRRFADGTLFPLWMEAAGSFSRVVDEPAGARLWFDARHVPFLREDAKDEADIFQTQAAAIRQLIDGGFSPDAAVAAAQAAELGQLKGKHTGKLSVQLQPTDATDATDDGEPSNEA